MAVLLPPLVGILLVAVVILAINLYWCLTAKADYESSAFEWRMRADKLANERDELSACVSRLRARTHEIQETESKARGRVERAYYRLHRYAEERDRVVQLQAERIVGLLTRLVARYRRNQELQAMYEVERQRTADVLTRLNQPRSPEVQAAERRLICENTPLPVTKRPTGVTTSPGVRQERATGEALAALSDADRARAIVSM